MDQDPRILAKRLLTRIERKRAYDTEDRISQEKKTLRRGMARVIACNSDTVITCATVLSEKLDGQQPLTANDLAECRQVLARIVKLCRETHSYSSNMFENLEAGLQAGFDAQRGAGDGAGAGAGAAAGAGAGAAAGAVAGAAAGAAAAPASVNDAAESD